MASVGGLGLVSTVVSPDDAPFACDLSTMSTPQREREKSLLAGFRRSFLRFEELPEGWRFFVPATQESLRDVGELLALERVCCPFLEFRLEVGPGELAVVEIRGREGAKAVIAAEFLP